MKNFLVAIFLLELFHVQSWCYDKKAKNEMLRIKLPNEVTQPLESTATYRSNLLNKIVDRLSFETEKGRTVLMLPLIYSSKNLGARWGFMPIIALRDEKNGAICSVIAPSYDFNSYLGNTVSYRHYLFPDEKSIFVLRGSYSEKVSRELLFSYYTPDILGKNFRLNAEVWKSADPESFFYGYGISSPESDKTNYALYSGGGSLSLTTRLYKSFHLDFTSTYYTAHTGMGVVKTSVDFKDRFPAEYVETSAGKDFVTNKFSFILDNTDHPFFPRIGNLFTFSMLFSRENLMSDYDYSVYAVEGKSYYNSSGRNKYITAVRYLFQWQTGEKIPFYSQSVVGESTGLRMVGNGRYTDRGKFLFNVEERIIISRSTLLKFVSEFEMAPFLDAGTVFEKPSDFSLKNLKLGPGVAFRVLLRPQIAVTVDFAIGEKEMNAIIKAGYPF